MVRRARLLDPPSMTQTEACLPPKSESNAVFRISKAAGVHPAAFLCFKPKFSEARLNITMFTHIVMIRLFSPSRSRPRMKF